MAVPSAIRAGTAAFAVVFATGFALGTLRAMLVAPRLGETTAVLIELPLMLAASWATVGWAIRGWHLDAVGARAVVGLVAFGLLILAELALGVSLFGQSASQWARALLVPPGLYGFAAQVAFGFMPLLAGRRR